MRSKKLTYSFLILAIFACFLATNGWADTYALMTIEGQNQGLIAGDGFGEIEDVIYVASFGQSVTVPFIQSTGQVSAARVHNPLRVVKRISKATPLLFKACITGEVLDVVIRFYRTARHGGVENFFTITLEEAKIISVAPSLVPSVETDQLMEIVSFLYKKIIWKHEESGTEEFDDWRVPAG